MVDRQYRPVRGRVREHVAQPRELVVGEIAVVIAGDRGVEGDDAQSADVEHPVLGSRGPGPGLVGGVLVVQGLGEAGRVVVVADHPDHLRAHGRGGLFDAVPQPLVGVDLADVRQVAGEHQRVRSAAGSDQPIEGAIEVGPAVHRAVELAAAAEQMGVAQMRQDVGGRRVLAQHRVGGTGRLAGLVHPASLRRRDAQRQPGRLRIRRCRAARRVRVPGHHALTDRPREPISGAGAR